jgi:hypothetical protein
MWRINGYFNKHCHTISFYCPGILLHDGMLLSNAIKLLIEIIDYGEME